MLREPTVQGAGAAVTADGLQKSYPGGVRALDGLSFVVARGSVFGLLGPNGAGKSTTIKVLSTLTRADAGRATVAGLDVAGDPAAVRRAIGVVSQRSGADRELTGRENLRLQGRLFGHRGADLDGRVSELLDRFRLSDAADRPVRTWSGGMQRRLDVAQGLVHRPEVLFLDEPTTGLDPEVRVEMWDEVARLRDEEGLTIVLTTHYLEEADHLAAEVAIVDRGRVVASGSPASLKAEMRGDAVHVELRAATAEAAVLEALQHAGVRDVVVDGVAVHARADDGAASVPEVLAALDHHGLAVASVTVARPSLDDVYLRHAGRTLAEAQR